MITRLFGDHLQAQGNDQGVVSVRQLPKGTLMWSSEEQVGRHFQPVTVLSWSHDGRYLASGSSDATIKVWDAATGDLLQTYAEHTTEVYALAWSPKDLMRRWRTSTDEKELY